MQRVGKSDMQSAWQEIHLAFVFLEAADLTEDLEHTIRHFLELMPKWKRQKNDVPSKLFVLPEIPPEVMVLVLR